MSIHLSWYNDEKTAFRVRYEVGWTWAHHHNVIKQMAQWRKEHRLPNTLCLFDLRGTTIPFDSPAGEHYHHPHESSFIVVVLNHTFTHTIVQLLIRARGHQHLVHLTNTLEEGEALLNQTIIEHHTKHNG